MLTHTRRLGHPCNRDFRFTQICSNAVKLLVERVRKGGRDARNHEYLLTYNERLKQDVGLRDAALSGAERRAKIHQLNPSLPAEHKIRMELWP